MCVQNWRKKPFKSALALKYIFPIDMEGLSLYLHIKRIWDISMNREKIFSIPIINVLSNPSKI